MTIKKPGYEVFTFPIAFAADNKVVLKADLKKIDYNTSMQFGKIVASIPSGTVVSEVGIIKVGFDVMYKMNYNAVEVETGKMLQQLGLSKNESNIFNTKSSQKVKYLIGGTIEKLYYMGQANFSGMMRNASAATTVKWEVFDVENETVIVKGTERAIFDTAQISLDELIARTVAKSMGNFLASHEVLNVIQEKKEEEIKNDFDVLTLKKYNAEKVSNSNEIFRSFSDAVVTVKRGNGGHGTGFFVSKEGYLLTNAHVVENGGDLEVVLNNGFSVPVEVVRKDKKNDVALLKVKASSVKSVALGNSANITVGDDVTIIGTPIDLSLSQTFSKGIISGKRNFEGKNYYQTDASVNKGNSGGPVFSKTGEVIGIISLKVIDSGVEGIGFLIPLNDALQSLNIALTE
ncbi:MAG: trypsin-like serine protease [Pedobacter sp.]|nr:MAG: trypsin-like serine protease [Pedobacter sp.]